MIFVERPPRRSRITAQGEARVMKTFALALFALAAATLLATDQGAVHNDGRYEQAFTDNGRVSMELGGGDYEIRAGAADKIVVVCTAQNPDQLKQADVRFIGGRDATKLKVSGPH